MSCDYIYNGKKYSRVGILATLANAQPLFSEKSREFLRSKLGMLDSEIEIVQGLIEGKTLGRLKEDGNILLSVFADDSVVYHEAFHRVFRMYLTSDERTAIYNEFKQKPNWKELADKYKKLYPENSIEDNIEEFLADEFADYILNNESLKTPYKSLFDRLINFIRKILGLKTKNISDLYKDILQSRYKGKPLDVKYRYNRKADKVLIGKSNYSHDVKNDFVQAVSKEFIGEVLKQGSVYDLISGKIGSSIQTQLYRQSFVRVAEALSEDYPDMINDFLDDFELGVDSYLNNQFKLYIQTLVGKFDFNIVENAENLQEDEGVGEEEKGRLNDDASKAWTASIEIDPKTSMSKSIKILLASFVDETKTNNIGLYNNVRWSNAFNKIAQHLAGVPTSDVILHLSKLNETWVKDLIDMLGGINPTNLSNETFRLRTDFIKTFSKTQNTYMILEVGDNTIKAFDANQNTLEKKKLREWNDNMVLAIKNASNDGNFSTWVERVESEIINSKTPNLKLYEELTGITIDPELQDKVLFTQNNQDFYYDDAIKFLATTILNEIKEKKFNNANQPDYKNLFTRNNFDIEGTLKKLVEAQNQYEDNVDLMVYSRDKKLYGISLNTLSTTTINTLNYIADLVDPNDSLENNLKLIEKYLPSMLNYQTIDKINGKYVVKSKWLNHILSGKKIKLLIIDGVKNELGDSEALSDIDESDLLSATLNLSLRNVNISIKHSDRSVFYAYQLEGDSIFDYQDGPYNDENEILNYLTSVLQYQLATEVKRANLKDLPLYQYFKDKYKDSQLFNIKDIQKLNAFAPDIKELIYNTVKDSYTEYKKLLESWGVIEDSNDVLKGLSQDLLSYHNNNLNLALASSYANQMLTHLEEMKVFLGDFTFFKTAEDLYKRMSTTSGTGEQLVNEEITNNKIKEANNVEFEILNPRTNTLETLTYNKEIDGHFTSMTSNEKDDYVFNSAKELTHVSPIDGSQISEVQYIFEWNSLQDFGENVTDDIKKDIKKASEQYASTYQKVNENDGQSWINMFFYREYMMRIGAWTQAMDNLFKAELKILNAKSLDDVKDLTVTIDGETINVFDYQHWQDGLFEAVHTLKPQYAGPTQAYTEYKKQIEGEIKDYSERVFPYTIYKTSYHVLWPSTVIGTNLSQMHYFMLKNKVDVIHMNSANKSGAVDIKSVFKSRQSELNKDQELVAKEGWNFYDSYGHFNDFVFEGELGTQLLESSKSVGSVNYMKDQVKIGNHEKTKIKGSTQSLKILLSNLINNGTPRFEGADTLANNYKKIISKIVEQSVQELIDEIGGDANLQNLVDVIKKSAEDKSSPINIIEAIEAFLVDPYIETLPNKNKLENIFYSIITNNVISFNRPGNAYPQVASTGFENIGERNREIANDDLKFYSFETNESGDVVKVNPSEIIIPLPQAWIPSVLAKAGTNNIVEAVNWLNNKIESGKINSEVTFKGLRIPNQQLSSNDVMKVKKFKVPSNASYVIVSSPIVVKVGSDMDVDKVSIYWSDSNNLFNNKRIDFNPDNIENYSKEDLYKALLQLEQDILLHPRNAHLLMMPVIDDILKKDAFNKIVIEGRGKAKDNTTFFQSLTPQKNVEKAIQFIKSKFGVGVVALDITGHSVFSSENININPIYFNPSDEFKPYSTALRFEGFEDNYSLGAMYDASNRIISEIQSQTMTSQVDAGKDPYAVLLGINNQTLGVMMYLVRRGVPATTVLTFLSQPLIRAYLREQRKNEALINKQRGDELLKSDLIVRLLNKYGLKNIKSNKSSIKLSELDAGLKLTKMNQEQVEYLNYFLELIDQSGAFNDLKNGITVDTKGKKDKSALENFEDIWTKIEKTQIISTDDLNKLKEDSILAPFFEAQKLYRQLYSPFYAIDSSKFGQKLRDLKTLVSSRQKGDYKKEKAKTFIDNDFLLFLIQNSHPDFNENVFDELFGLKTGVMSLAERIKTMDKKHFDNPVIKALYPLINVERDAVHSKAVDVVRLFERELSSIDLNDFIDAMKDIRDEIDEDLYKSIIQLGLYQAGFNNSPFSLNKIFPTFKSSVRENGKLVDFQNDYMREIQLSIIKKLPEFESDADNLYNHFEELFYRNNTEFLPKRYSKYSPIKFFYTYSKTDNKRHLMFKPSDDYGNIYPPVLGGTYFKRYFISNSLGLVNNAPTVEIKEESTYENESEQPSILNDVFTVDEMQKAEELKEECKGTKTKIVK